MPPETAKTPLSTAKPEKLFLPNGLLVYLFEDHELPLIDLAFYMKAGSIFDPADRIGLADMATLLMRTGGTLTMTPDQVDQAIESMPAQVALDAANDAVSGSLSALKARFPDALAIVGAMLQAPRFDPARLDLEKARAVEEIRSSTAAPARGRAYQRPNRSGESPARISSSSSSATPIPTTW